MAWNKVKSIFIVFSLIFSLFFGIAVFTDEIIEQATAVNAIYVDCNGHGNYTTIQGAIDNANTGDIIYVWAGTYNENVLVNKSVNLIGNGSAVTIIDGGKNGSVISIDI